MNNNNKTKEVEFEGKVVRQVYANDEDTFRIYALEVPDNEYPELHRTKYGSVSIMGDLHELGVGITYKVKATESYGKNGYSYKVIHISRDKPHTQEEIFAFLQEILTYNQANALYGAYPDIVDRVINNKTDDIDLSKVKGIGEATFNKIKDKIISNFCLIELVSEFQGFISLTIIRKLYQHFVSVQKIKSKLKTEPYSCLCSLSGVGFATADAILLDLEKLSKKNVSEGKPPIIEFSEDLLSSYDRCLACVKYLLAENEDEGNTYMDITALREQVIKLCPACSRHYVECLKSDGIYYDVNTMRVSKRSTYETEKYVADKIVQAIKTPKVWENVDYSKYKEVNGYTLSDEQLSLLPMVCDNNIVILNGAAGTGKTSSVSALMQLLSDNLKSCYLFAPTGKAAKVLSESTHKSASTIHRGLNYMPPLWGYNEQNKLCADIVIVDETSMVDVFLMRHLIEAIDLTTTKLLFIGDSSQLASVGSGNCFYDFISSGLIPTLTLSKVFRYGEGGLMTVATDVRLCKPYLRQPDKRIDFYGDNKDYGFVQCSGDNIIKNTVAIYSQLLKNGIEPNDIKVLTAYKKGDFGTVALNNHIQKIANPNYNSGDKMEFKDVTYYKGDIIMQNVNNYKALVDTSWDNGNFCEDDEKQTFIANGETGTILKINNSNILIDFDGVRVIYTRDDMQKCSLGYVISIHKSQGSSIKNVILVTPQEHTYMLNSNLIYVGLTRTKEKCYHLGVVDTINKAVKKVEHTKRSTFMQDLLNQINKEGMK